MNNTLMWVAVVIVGYLFVTRKTTTNTTTPPYTGGIPSIGGRVAGGATLSNAQDSNQNALQAALAALAKGLNTAISPKTGGPGSPRTANTPPFRPTSSSPALNNGPTYGETTGANNPEGSPYTTEAGSFPNQTDIRTDTLFGSYFDATARTGDLISPGIPYTAETPASSYDTSYAGFESPYLAGSDYVASDTGSSGYDLNPTVGAASDFSAAGDYTGGGDFGGGGDQVDLSSSE